MAPRSTLYDMTTTSPSEAVSDDHRYDNNIITMEESLGAASKKRCLSPSAAPSTPQTPTERTNNGLCKQRKVSFNRRIKFKEILHRNNYTQEEKDAVWYTRSEYQCIKENIKLTLAFIEGGMSVDSDDHCMRGLESRTRKGATKKARSRIDAREAVFEEQECQEVDGIIDPHAIADVYFICSNASIQEATLTGQRDAEEISRYCY